MHPELAIATQARSNAVEHTAVAITHASLPAVPAALMGGTVRFVHADAIPLVAAVADGMDVDRVGHHVSKLHARVVDALTMKVQLKKRTIRLTACGYVLVPMHAQ
jgi:hypothetical protein